MREILFRGKRKNNRGWICGSLVKKVRGVYIISESITGCIADYTEHEVYPETVCQYTGLKDGYGNKIWENDILSFSAYGEKYKGYVKFVDGNFVIWCGKCAPFLDDALEKHSAIVIGNIFDNPELIGDQP